MPLQCFVPTLTFGERLTGILNAQATATTIGVASRTGLLAALGPEPASAAALAGRAGLALRYVEETLAVLVTGDIAVLSEGEGGALAYALPADRKSVLNSMGLYFEEIPLLSQCAFAQVCDAAKAGGGVASSNYGPFGAWMGRVADEKHERTLVSQMVPALDNGAVASKLQGSAARVLDLGCGEGVAARLIAKAFPQAAVTGLDVDASAIKVARERASAEGVANVDYCVEDGSALMGAGAAWEAAFDVVFAFDVIHDLTDPAGALRSVRRALRSGGCFAMVDIRAGTGLRANLDHAMAPFLYTVSLMHCMPQGMNDGGPGLGMMWGRQKACEMLNAAGFESIEVVEFPFDTFNDCYLCRV
mmetsp:Transcript_41819/g.116640  ORF Transcript_41819/g.116640 Transcript_41819/m.116640 type:complete len:360 (-) Transcript_41819:90-1169(-)